MNQITSIVSAQRQFFQTGKTRSLHFRLNQLKKLKQMLKTHEVDIYAALNHDLNKARHETLTTELGFLYMEIDFALKHLKTWAQPEKVQAPVTHKGTKNYIYKVPYGRALIIAPWNYPLQLALSPAIGAIAAGNCVVIKPSEHAQATARLLEKMVAATFSSSYVTVVTGQKDVSTALLAERFDYIFFTGSSNVGKIVMKAASRFLTPITLELGGKSPAIVDADADIKRAAKRIVWGKYTNAGQTCVAPDFLYVHKQVYKQFIKAAQKYIKRFYGKQPLHNPDYVKIINDQHFQRLSQFLKEGHVIHGGEISREKCMIAPTLLNNITWQDSVMKEEIFGPILPIMTFSTRDEVLQQLQTLESPLALYYFGKRDDAFAHLRDGLSFGGGCMNDTLYHLANPHLPFGGVGMSGMGAYHGQYSFETFSHRKSILKQTNAFDIPLRYPGRQWTHKLVRKIMK